MYIRKALLIREDAIVRGVRVPSLVNLLRLVHSFMIIDGG